MEFRVKFSVAMVLAVVLGEVASFLWYSHYSSWYGRYGDRYLLTAIIADVGLVVLLKWIMENFWSVRRWQDAAILCMWLATLFACLQAPHFVYNSHSFSWFLFHALHKFILMFVMTFSLHQFKSY